MPEIWDVYDVNRQRTGKTIVRAESWGNEKEKPYGKEHQK